jgi:hypothetical protein
MNYNLPIFINVLKQQIEFTKSNPIDEVIAEYKNFILQKDDANNLHKILQKHYEERFIKENIDINNL